MSEIFLLSSQNIAKFIFDAKIEYLKFLKKFHAAIFMNAAAKVFSIDLRGSGQTN